MTPVDPSAARELLDVAVTSISILGGTMAYLSGYWAADSLGSGDPPTLIAQRINEGVAVGFIWGAPLAILALIIVMWS